MKDELDLVLLLAGALFVVAQIVLHYVKKANPPVVYLAPDSESKQKIEDLHEWHSHRDQNGRFTWWQSVEDRDANKQSLKALHEISNTQRELVHTLKAMAQTQDNTTYLIKECLTEIKDIRKESK